MKGILPPHIHMCGPFCVSGRPHVPLCGFSSISAPCRRGALPRHVASVGEDMAQAQGVGQFKERDLMSQVGSYPVEPPTSYGERVGSETAGDLRPRQAGLLLEPLQALWEFVGEYVGPWAVVCVRSQHGEPVLPQDSRTLTYGSARPGGITAPTGHPCMRPVMLSAARRS